MQDLGLVRISKNEMWGHMGHQSSSKLCEYRGRSWVKTFKAYLLCYFARFFLQQWILIDMS